MVPFSSLSAAIRIYGVRVCEKKKPTLNPTIEDQEGLFDSLLRSVELVAEYDRKIRHFKRT